MLKLLSAIKNMLDPNPKTVASEKDILQTVDKSVSSQVTPDAIYKLSPSIPLHFSDTPLNVSDKVYTPTHALKCTVNGVEIEFPSSGAYFRDDGILHFIDGIGSRSYSITSEAYHLKVVQDSESGKYSMVLCDEHGEEFTLGKGQYQTNVTPNVLPDISYGNWDLAKMYESTKGGVAFTIVKGPIDEDGGARAELIPTAENYLSELYSDGKPIAHLGNTFITLEEQYGALLVEYYKAGALGLDSVSLEAPSRGALEKLAQELTQEGHRNPLYLVIKDNKVGFSSHRDADVELQEDELLISWLRTAVEFPEDKRSFQLMLTPADNIIDNRFPLQITSLDPSIKVLRHGVETDDKELFLDTNDLTITLEHIGILTAVNPHLQWIENIVSKITPVLFRLELKPGLDPTETSFQLTCTNIDNKVVNVDVPEFGQMIESSVRNAGFLSQNDTANASNATDADSKDDIVEDKTESTVDSEEDDKAEDGYEAPANDDESYDEGDKFSSQHDAIEDSALENYVSELGAKPPEPAYTPDYESTASQYDVPAFVPSEAETEPVLHSTANASDTTDANAKYDAVKDKIEGTVDSEENDKAEDGYEYPANDDESYDKGYEFGSQHDAIKDSAHENYASESGAITPEPAYTPDYESVEFQRNAPVIVMQNNYESTHIALSEIGGKPSFNIYEWNSSSQHKIYINSQQDSDHPENYPLWIRATYDEIKSFYTNVRNMYANEDLTHTEAMVLYDNIVSHANKSTHFYVQGGTVDVHGNVTIKGHSYWDLDTIEKMFTSSL